MKSKSPTVSLRDCTDLVDPISGNLLHLGASLYLYNKTLHTVLSVYMLCMICIQTQLKIGFHREGGRPGIPPPLEI